MRGTNTGKTEVDAAMYVRMSTESQNYSTDHQRAKIRQYAIGAGLRIVREYADEGKSGLDIKGRAGLQSLISDVQSGLANFATIVVYDVSRWGRFQDVDEAAYHEHTCRRAGISVVYCEEQFQNDGSPLGSLLKTIKRTMAAEYSRELSQKVFAAQCRFIEMGFKQGGHAGYGLRRLAVTADGNPRRVLAYNEAKGAVTDRVLLILGPDHEVAMVKRIYGLYLDSKLSEAAIARLLNAEGVSNEMSRPWTQTMVNSILTNVKYIGSLVFNRRSCKLSTLRKRNAPEQWIVNDGAIESLLSPALFQLAQEERVRRNRRYDAAELIVLLQECYTRHGNVTSKIIAADRAMPDPQLFSRMFGSLVLAYDCAALPRTSLHRFVDTKRLLLRLTQDIVEEMSALAHAAGAVVTNGMGPFTLVLNGSVSVRVAVATRRLPLKGRPSWKVSPYGSDDYVLVARLNPTSGKLLDYHLLPRERFGGRPIYLKDPDAADIGYSTLTELFGR